MQCPDCGKLRHEGECGPDRSDDDAVAIRLLERIGREAADYLDQVANTMDNWAWHSKTGGWSTHQVADNTTRANDCRRRAAEIRVAVTKICGPSSSDAKQSGS
jgi:hypothetical protein